MTPAARIGVTGHQSRPGIDWGWVADRIDEQLELAAGSDAAAASCLAAGADTVFAERALERGLPVTGIIPMPDYERFFEGDDLATFRDLSARCRIEELPGAETDEEAFMAASRRLVDGCDLLVAVWDGEEAAGHGGTADVVDYALARGVRVVQIEPIGREVRVLEASG